MADSEMGKIHTARVWKQDAVKFLGLEADDLYANEALWVIRWVVACLLAVCNGVEFRLATLGNKLDALLGVDVWLDCMLVGYLDSQKVGLVTAHTWPALMATQRW